MFEKKLLAKIGVLVNRSRHNRNSIVNARRLVVKVGSRVLVEASGRPHEDRVKALVQEISSMVKAGREVVLVTSGAVGIGMQVLGWKKRPSNMPDLQMAAAVGQSRLMALYDRLFSGNGLHIGQVLLTHDGLKQRHRHLNARHTMQNLLRHGIIPVVNENDAVAVDEIKFGDNDLLAALVTHLVDADALILLTTVNGLRRATTGGQSERVRFLKRVSEDEVRLTAGKGHELSTGGMASKLEAAQTVVKAGACVVIADGRMQRILQRIASGEDVGTFMEDADRNVMPGRQRWIAFFHRSEGTLHVDAGACRALEEKGRSLLPIGIVKVDGPFQAGSVVTIRHDNRLIAKGLTDYSSRDIDIIKGKKTDEITGLLGSKDYDEAVHRDNMVLFKNRKGEL